MSPFYSLAFVVAGCGNATDPGPATVRIGALLPMTGALSSYGEASQAALTVAAKDVNAYFEDIAASIRVEIVVEDTASDPPTAFAKLGALSGQGIDVIVGPIGSDELAEVGPLARRLNVFLLSPAGGGVSLAGPNDNLFRLVPDDSLQAQALTALLNSRGVTAVALLVRDGSWGAELANLIADRFTDRGGVVVANVRFDPTPAAGLDFRAQLAQLSAAVVQARNDFGANGVAVALLSYDEGLQIFKQAAADEALSAVPWFGADGFVLSADLLLDARASAFAATVRFTASMYAGRQVDPERQAAVRDPVETAIARPAEVFAFTAYDALWLAALALSQAGDTPSVTLLQSAAASASAVYNGASGRTLLNDAGDRTGGTYDFWLVDDGELTWRRVATFADGEIMDIAAGTANDASPTE